MLSNHRVISAINKLLENRKVRTLLNVVVYVIILFVIGLFIQYLELNFSLLRTTHENLKLREIKYESIGYAFITLSIGVLSIGSIMFTLLIGKIQSLVNEVNYSSFHRKTYIDGKTLDNYILLMSISIVLLFIYLVADISAYPITYMIILLIAFLSVVYILSTLFTSLLDDLNLFRILEKNYITISLKFEDFKKSHTRFKRLLKNKEKLISNQRKKRRLQKLDKRIEFLKNRLESISNNHYIECIHSIEEIKQIVVTACRRKDPELLRTTLEYLEKHIRHHLEVMNYSIDESIKFWSEYPLGNTFSFIVFKFLPIYENSELYNSELSLTEIAHASFTYLLFEKEVFKPGGQEIDDSDFRVVLEKYYAMTVKCIHSGLNSEVYKYYLTINYMIEILENNSIKKLRKISSINIDLIAELIATSSTEYYKYVFIIQSKILRKVMWNENPLSSNYFAVSGFFELFEKYINSIDATQNFSIMSTVSSCLNNDEYDSISQILSDAVANIESREGGAETSRFEVNLSKDILNLLDKKRLSILKAISLDESIFFGFDSILNRVMDILRKNIGLKGTNYHMRLMEESLKQYCDYLLVYNGFDNWHAFIEMERTFKKLFHDNNVKESAINAYADLIKMIVINDIKISKSANETDKLFLSTIDIEGIIVQMYYFEDYIFESILNKINLLLSKEELEFLFEHIIGLIVELNTEFSNELFSNEVLSDINKSEFKRELGSLIGLYIEASQAYDNNEG